LASSPTRSQFIQEEFIEFKDSQCWWLHLCIDGCECYKKNYRNVAQVLLIKMYFFVKVCRKGRLVCMYVCILIKS
jgi:hypothetical protein